MGMIGRLSAVSFTSIPTCVGFFASRHLGLLGCKIVLMKIGTYSSTGILLLFILIGEEEIN